MSFVIGISDGNIAKIAADGRRMQDGKIAEERYKKIKTFIGNTTITIGFAGDVGLANLVFNKLNEIPISTQYFMNIEKYAYEIQKIANFGYEYNNINRNDRFCAFILMARTNYIDRARPKFLMYLVNTKTNQVSQAFKGNETYYFFYTQPREIDQLTLSRIIDSNLYSPLPYTLDQKLSNIIHEVAARDSTVNENVDIYTI